jgi:FG-GAP-like repeat
MNMNGIWNRRLGTFALSILLPIYFQSIAGAAQPSVPSNWAASPASCDKIFLSWSATNDFLTSMSIEVSFNGIGGPFQSYSGVGPAVGNFDHIFLQSHREYCYRLSATRDGIQRYSNTSCATTPYPTPAIPGPISFRVDSASFVWIEWVDSGFACSQESGFEIYRRHVASHLPGVPIGGTRSNVNSFVDQHAQSGETYCYKLRSYFVAPLSTAQTFSEFGQEACVIVTPSPPSPPPPPADSRTRFNPTGGALAGVTLKNICQPYVADFNGDGKADIFRACDNDLANELYVSTGRGFRGVGGALAGVTLKNTCQPYVADFNGDGGADIFRACDNDRANEFYVSTGSGFRGVGGALVGVTLKNTCQTYVADFNGDGRADIFRACDSVQANELFVSTGAGFRGVGGALLGVGLNPRFRQIFALDFDGDGKADIFRASLNRRENELFFSTGMGFYGTGGTLTNDYLIEPNILVGPYVADFDGDGKADILRVWWGGKFNELFVNSSTGFVDVGTILPAVELTNTCSLFPADFNGDHKADLFRACDNNAANELFLKE